MTNVIYHVFDIAAPRETVFHAITSVEGLSGWWTTAVRGDGDTVGGELEFSFRGAFNPRMQVAQMLAPVSVVWEGTGGHQAWGETTIRFELDPAPAGTLVRFRHQVGPELAADAVASVNFNWGYYLDSLRLVCETGRGKPYAAGSPDARVAADTKRPAVDVVEVEVDIPAPANAVFPFLIEADRHVQWMGTTAELEPRAGGRYRVQMDDQFGAAGTFLNVDPDRRVVFTWGWLPGAGQAVLSGAQEDVLPPGSTRVEITLEGRDGGTRLTLRHHDLLTHRLRADHQLAWDTYLKRLATVCAGGDPGPDPHH